MIIDVVKEKVYVPEWNGNRELPEEEQIKVTHRFLSPTERKKYYNHEIDSDYKVQPKLDPGGHARAVITKIENLSINIGGAAKPIRTGADLYTTNGVPWRLTDEIETYLVKEDAEADTNPLQQPSPST